MLLGAPAGRGARRTRTRGPGGRPRTGPGGRGKTPGGPGEDSARTAAGPAAAGRRQGRAVGGRGGPGQVELQLEVQPAGGGGQAAGKPRTFVGRRGTRRGRDKPGCGPGGPGLAGAARTRRGRGDIPRGRPAEKPAGVRVPRPAGAPSKALETSSMSITWHVNDPSRSPCPLTVRGVNLTGLSKEASVQRLEEADLCRGRRSASAAHALTGDTSSHLRSAPGL